MRALGAVLLATVAALAVGSCSKVLGIDHFTHVDAGDPDAPADGPVVDGRTVDGAPADGPITDGPIADAVITDAVIVDTVIADAPGTCGDGVVQAPEQCDSGAVDSLVCDADCTFRVCGDHHVNAAAGEVCDDGNTIDGDGCAANCKSFETCGNMIVDNKLPNNPTSDPIDCLSATATNHNCAEVCDDGNNFAGDGCSPNCLSSESCGNRIVDSTEECDDGNSIDTDACRNNCAGAVCGDGVRHIGVEDCDSGGIDTASCVGSTCKTTACGDAHTNSAAGEQCDDGNLSNTDACTNTCKLAACGDGFVQAGEQCDDGNTVNESACPYGTATCMACSASCTVLLLTGNVCGDGVVDVAHEACDDRNTSACGSCNATCQMTQASAPAVGVVVCPKGMEFIDGETLTLNDGVNAPTVFEFDFGGGVAGGHVAIALTSGDGSSTVGSQVKTKINAIGAGLAITATNSSGTVNLTNDRASVAGNAPIIETVVTPNFTVNGMSGGAGGDCPSGTGCKTNNDCVSGVCGAGSTCQ